MMFRGVTVSMTPDATPRSMHVELAAIVGLDHVLVDDAGTYSTDWTRRYVAGGSLVVRPGTRDEVAAIVNLCRRRRVALIPQGGNTGLVGGGVPMDGEVVLSMRRFDAIGSVDTSSRQVTVGAGVTLSSLQQVAEDVGLRYAVDFGARGSATVGGMVATNAGGINVVRHGMTRSQVVGVEAVLGDGRVLSHLSGLEKDNTGYDLVSLMCGSEGTLGIVTAVRVRLVPQHSHITTVLVGFDSIAHAVAAVGVLCSGLDIIDAAELMLADGVALVADAFDVPVPFDAPVYVLFEASADSDPSEAVESLLVGCHGVTHTAVAVDSRSRRDLWRIRDEHTAAISTVGVPHKFDVTVAVSDLPVFIDRVRGAVGQVCPTAVTHVFGHAADGNMHVNVLGSVEHDAAVEEAVLGLVLEMRGSVSAEHGVGRLKRTWMPRQRSAAELDMMRGIKRTFDPDLILNPNVLLPHW